jgi:hypothetical protein
VQSQEIAHDIMVERIVTMLKPVLGLAAGDEP